MAARSSDPEGSGGATAAPRATRELRRAERLAARGQVAEAIERLDVAIRLGADAYTCYLRQARLYQARQQWKEAVCAAEKAIAERPDKLSAREAIITLYLEMRNFQCVVDASKALLKLAPRHVPARDAMGAAYIGLGDVDAALRVANDLVRIAPNDAGHHFKRALLCQHRGDMRLAVEEFSRVLELAPESDIAQNAREQLDTLDSFQIGQILTLALEDAVFRIRLSQNAEDAAEQRGFCLSTGGRQILHDVTQEMLAEVRPDCRVNLYH